MKLSNYLSHLFLLSTALALPSPPQGQHENLKRDSLAPQPLLSPRSTPSLVRRDDEDNTINLCHSPTSKYYIHLYDPQVKNITLYLNIPWIILYPQQLKPKLRAAGFTLTTPKTQAKCGWTLVDKVSAKAVDRANIGYRQSAGLDANTTLVPSEETVARLREILLRTYPSLEIALIVGLMVVLPISLCFCWVCCEGRRNMKTRRSKVTPTPKPKPKPKPKAAKKTKTTTTTVESEKTQQKDTQEPPPYS